MNSEDKEKEIDAAMKSLKISVKGLLDEYKDIAFDRGKGDQVRLRALDSISNMRGLFPRGSGPSVTVNTMNQITSIDGENAYEQFRIDVFGATPRQIESTGEVSGGDGEGQDGDRGESGGTDGADTGSDASEPGKA